MMVIAVLALGFRKLSSLMPVASSCSAAISAACHPPSDDVDPACKAVSWGQVEQEPNRIVGHCSFTSLQVYAATSEHMYL